MSHETQTKKTALIAGAGIAGLAAALHLDELGYEVTLIERKPQLGGRTYSFKDKVTGHTVDNGQHLMIGAYHHTLDYLERIGAKSKIEIKIPTQIPLRTTHHKTDLFDLQDSLWPSWGLAKTLLRFKGITLKDKFNLMRLAPDLLSSSNKTQTKLNQMTVYEWLKNSGQSELALKNFWDVLTLATLNDSMHHTSADGLWQVLRGSYFGQRHDGFLVFPKVGLSELLVDPAEKYLQLRHHHLTRGIGLKSIQMMNNEVQGFVFSDGSILKADLYVSALPHTQLLSTLPEPFVTSHHQLSKMKTVTGSPIISINLFFKNFVMPDNFIGSASTRTHWFFNRGFLKNHHSHNTQHIMGVISGAYDLVDKDKQELTSQALNDLKSIYPQLDLNDLHSSLINKERTATLSSRVGVNQNRPHQKLLSNFYVVGDWTQTHLPATIESAIKSAFLMRQQLEQSL